MSWFSKMINYFAGETETDKHLEKTAAEKRQIPEQQQQPVHRAPVPPKTQPSNVKNVETKVAYQYPKGNFKFPMIPDHQKTRPEPRRKSPKSAKTERTKPKKVSSTGSIPGKSARIKTKSDSKRPFHPTEIPSPIYGFRPRDNQEPLEYRISPRNEAGQSSGEPVSSLFKSFQEAAQSTESVMSKLNEHKRAELLKREAARMREREAAEIPVSPVREIPREDEQVILSTEETEPVPVMIPEISVPNEELKTDTQLLSFEHEDDQEEISILSSFQTYKKEVQPLPYENREVAAASDETGLLLTEQVDPPIVKAEEEPFESIGVNKEKQTMPEWNPVEESEESEETPEAGVITASDYELFQTDAHEVISHDKEEETRIMDLPGKTAPEITDEQPSKEGESIRSGRSTVPFNVMMFGRDKQKIQKSESSSNSGSSYLFPSLQLLNIPPKEYVDDVDWLREQTELLNVTLENFNVKARVVHVTQGPAVTRLEVQPEPGVKVNKITNLTDDIKLSLSAKDIRIEAPIPGKNRIGIEVPNRHSKMVYLREILRSADFRNNPSPLTAALGLDISGQAVVTDLKKMPHGLIAGATGSGKSVCINTILVSLLYKASPHEVKLLLIDPKMVELAPYHNVPHLVSPVITDVKAATGALKWAVEEMERRYELLAHAGARDISRYNELVAKHNSGEHMPYLVIVIDELADLMMAAPADVEEAICRIAQKARACGIHLIVATQRPSVDVITGLIKSNIPTRIAFSVSSQVDSRTIIDSAGAEKLLGKGDMLFLENGTSKAVRIQGNFVSDEEIERVVSHAKKQMKPVFLFEQEDLMKKSSIGSEEDELLLEACEYVVDQGGASTSSLQRRFRIGYNRAARLMDMMEKQGIISEARGSKPREVLISEQDLETIQESGM
ncbi:DNA translocase FtsK [Peribacillus frigoritolerans]|uniref:DNA translocase FtsK n=1 Tax=Peribacillus frigoritolerans TaxID=450367 RepID=UPI00105A1ADC|nr:DNA translocase FtsK [Peribacillus frigoritolerans]TDL76460.1 DNA translocase FtsK [Peribacillus frigoritolerans]